MDSQNLKGLGTIARENKISVELVVDLVFDLCPDMVVKKATPAKYSVVDANHPDYAVFLQMVDEIVEQEKQEKLAEEAAKKSFRENSQKLFKLEMETMNRALGIADKIQKTGDEQLIDDLDKTLKKLETLMGLDLL